MKYNAANLAGTATPLGEGQTAQPLIDTQRRLVLSPNSTVIPGPPAAATTVGAAVFTVGASSAALSGTSGTGFTLLNFSTGGQTIYLDDTPATVAGGFPLAPGAAIDRASWQNLAGVFAIASAAGADLRVLPL